MGEEVGVNLREGGVGWDGEVLERDEEGAVVVDIVRVEGGEWEVQENEFHSIILGATG